MSLKSQWNDPQKRARLEMADAERKGRKASGQVEKKTEPEKPNAAMPQRYRLYDRIKVSVRTMDIIIYTVAALLVICIIVGIALGN